jgi:hypothetical protein
LVKRAGAADVAGLVDAAEADPENPVRVAAVRRVAVISAVAVRLMDVS